MKGYKQLWADLAAREISQTAALLYCWLQGRRNSNNEVRTTTSEIGEAIGLNRHTVGKFLRELNGRGYLSEKTYRGQHERVLIFGTGGSETANYLAAKQPTTWQRNSQLPGNVHGIETANSELETLAPQAPQRSFESLYPLRGDVGGGAPLGSPPHPKQEEKAAAKNFVAAFVAAMGAGHASQK